MGFYQIYHYHRLANRFKRTHFIKFFCDYRKVGLTRSTFV